MDSSGKKNEILLVGDRGCGKTSFIRRFIDGNFTNEYFPTNEMNQHQISFDYGINKKITFNVSEVTLDVDSFVAKNKESEIKVIPDGTST